MSHPDLTSLKASNQIPNIDIGKAYDQHYIDADIHYENLEKLAEFFGRNMPVHHHDRFYQIHVILNGTVHVHLDETSYSTEGPMLFFTPPTIPHAFITDNNSSGHVITVRQQLVWELLQGIEANIYHHSFINNPLCVALAPDTAPSASNMLNLLEMMAMETKQPDERKEIGMRAILQLILLNIARLSDQGQPKEKHKKEDVRIFHKFNELIEQHYKDHRTLLTYAEEIGVTEARLNEICRRLSGLPSKRLVMDRLMQEARRLLTFSSSSITEISYELGFKDPAYFARFFRRNAGVTASQFRQL